MGSVFAAVQNAANGLRPAVLFLGLDVDGHHVAFCDDHEEIHQPYRAEPGRYENGLALKTVRLLTEMASTNLHLVHGLQLLPNVCTKKRRR